MLTTTSRTAISVVVERQMPVHYEYAYIQYIVLRKKKKNGDATQSLGDIHTVCTMNSEVSIFLNILKFRGVRLRVYLLLNI